MAESLYDHVIAACQATGYLHKITYTPDLMATVLTMVAAELGVSIVPEGVRNLRSRQVDFVPISPALEPILLIMCWNTKQDSPPHDAFLNLVSEQLSDIQQSFL